VAGAELGWHGFSRRPMVNVSVIVPIDELKGGRKNR
jgi:hypothetical protein